MNRYHIFNFYFMVNVYIYYDKNQEYLLFILISILIFNSLYLSNQS